MAHWPTVERAHKTRGHTHAHRDFSALLTHCQEGRDRVRKNENKGAKKGEFIRKEMSFSFLLRCYYLSVCVCVCLEMVG